MSSRPSRGAARLAAILDALPDALLLVNANGTVVNANAIALEAFETPGTALVGRGLLDLLPSFDSKRIPGSMRRPDEEREGRTKPTRMLARRTDGTEFPVEVTSANLEDGRTPYADHYSYTGDELLMLVVRDLTGTMDTEAELARQQRQTEMILRAASEGIVGVDADGRVVLVNPSAAQILGFRASDLGGKQLLPLIQHSRPDGSPLPTEEAPLSDTLTSGRKHRVRGQVLWRKDGRPVPVDLTTAPVRDGDQLVGAVMTFTDRTALDALSRRHEQLRTVLDDSLRGPLDELRGDLSGLAADPAGQLWPEANQILHHLAAGYSRITTLIDNVLAYQRLDSGAEKLDLRPVGLDEVVAAGVEGAVELVGPGRAQYAVHAPALEVELDAGRMAQALAHLIADTVGVDATGNAAPLSGGDSTVVVAAAQRGEVVRIEVRGPHGGGNPVHLPITRGIVERHGGVLQTHEVPGQTGGSAYVLEVPLEAGGTAGGTARPGSGGGQGKGRRDSDTPFMPVPSEPARGTEPGQDGRGGQDEQVGRSGRGGQRPGRAGAAPEQDPGRSRDVRMPRQAQHGRQAPPDGPGRQSRGAGTGSAGTGSHRLPALPAGGAPVPAQGGRDLPALPALPGGQADPAEDRPTGRRRALRHSDESGQQFPGPAGEGDGAAHGRTADGRRPLALEAGPSAGPSAPGSVPQPTGRRARRVSPEAPEQQVPAGRAYAVGPPVPSGGVPGQSVPGGRPALSPPAPVAPAPGAPGAVARPQAPGQPVPPNRVPAPGLPGSAELQRVTAVRSLGQGVPFAQQVEQRAAGRGHAAPAPPSPVPPGQAPAAQNPSGRRRKLAAPAADDQRARGLEPVREQPAGPPALPSAAGSPAAEDVRGFRNSPQGRLPRPPQPPRPGTVPGHGVHDDPGGLVDAEPESAGSGRAFAIGAPAEGAEGPEHLDGPNGAVEVTDDFDAFGHGSFGGPRRLLVWPEPEAATRQALVDRGYEPVTVRSREEVDDHGGEPPAALFVDPLTGPITRTALQSLRTAAVEARVPVLVTAGLGQATRETAYGADPAVLLKALAPRDSEQHPPRVMLVEEHQDIAAAFTASLERRGMQVAHAPSEADAVNLAGRVQPNLVVMDLLLVRRRRVGIVDWLRGNGRLTCTPLVVYTSEGIDRSDLHRLGSGETVLFLAERSTGPDAQGRIVDLLGKIGSS
ncbi:PAS domain-containing protein [Streptomyces sp. HB2AG]|uniref:PAS domain-containing protein n=1 Tax=Streptomyces sp. HB2AG TaxID=2983400 RepID=UPI0022AA8C9A|nr:PAS domain-containing protein [Streptomyces sp. HB2AG]MCZ2525057.1 PAS domain-containing protein [Streptomyces sp. HB2AG]